MRNKVALVTGGSRGIGKAICIKLARDGFHIAFNYLRNHAAARACVKELKEIGIDPLAIQAHVGDPKQIRQLFVAVKERFGRLDILVNNAASGVMRKSMDLEEKHWDWTMGINAKGPWLCAQEAVRLMQDSGHIINITSLGSQRVLPSYSVVGVSKGALETLTRYLAVELAPRGIRVNGVSGGFVDTDALRYFPNPRKLLSDSLARTPAGRLVEPEDIAKVVAFLCSTEADMICGQILVVDGGMGLLG